jgi:hypothetical protein
MVGDQAAVGWVGAGHLLDEAVAPAESKAAGVLFVDSANTRASRSGTRAETSVITADMTTSLTRGPSTAPSSNLRPCQAVATATTSSFVAPGSCRPARS